MTHILYDRASKLFMDKISAGWDEIGAHAAVEKKYGVRLADTILGDARAEMKAMRRNPRGKDIDTVLRGIVNVDYTRGWINEKERDARLKEIKENPRSPNKIEIGKFLDDDDGIEKMIVVEKGHPGRTNYRVFAEPTKKGKETMAYREMQAHLGDDWFSDITDSWWEHGTLPKKMQEKIDKHIEELKALGYTRY